MEQDKRSRAAKLNEWAEKKDTPLFRLVSRAAMVLGAAIGAPALVILALGFRAKVNEIVSETDVVQSVAADVSQNASNVLSNQTNIQINQSQIRELLRQTADMQKQYESVRLEIKRDQEEIRLLQREMAAVQEWRRVMDNRLNNSHQ